MRRISLRAVADAQREDLIVYETPEYNSFLSIMHCPKKTIRSVLRYIPLMNRVIAPFAGAANYVNGSPGSTFRDTPDRLSQKKKMLSYFTSQDAALLVRIFGYESAIVSARCKSSRSRGVIQDLAVAVTSLL